jgi:hypothetical protein
VGPHTRAHRWARAGGGWGAWVWGWGGLVGDGAEVLSLAFSTYFCSSRAFTSATRKLEFPFLKRIAELVVPNLLLRIAELVVPNLLLNHVTC